MEYIVISMLTIAFFTYIVSLIAHKVLAIPIHIKSLVLCACCALLISLILPRMFVGFAGLSGTLGILIVFAMISSYFIAYYYDGVIQKVALEKNTPTEPVTFSVSEIVQADTNVEEDLQPVVELPQLLEMTPVENISQVVEEAKETATLIVDATTPSMSYPVTSEPEIKTEPVIEPTTEPKVELNDHSAVFFELLEKTTTLKNILEGVVPLTTEPVDATPITESMEKIYYYPMKCEEDHTKIPLKTTANDQPIDHSTNEQETNLHVPLLVVEITEDLPDFEIPKDMPEVFETKLPANDDNTMAELAVITEPILIEEKEVSTNSLDDGLAPTLEDSCESSTDLDVLMDFAFVYKEQRNFLKALKVFRQALRLYPDSEVAPFLVIEIGTILKNLGSYDEAIQIFVEGRELSGIINNSILEQQFINNIAYLRVVKNVLIEDSLENMPFNLIPENTFKKIDAEFCEWRNNQS